MESSFPTENENNLENRFKLTRYISFLSHDPENTSLLLDTLQIAVELGEFKTATEIIEQNSENHSGDPDFNALAGHIKLAVGEFQQALLFLNTAIELGNESPATHLNLAQCYNYLGDPQTTLSILNDSNSLEALYPSIYFPLYARSLYSLNDSKNAIKILDAFHEEHESTAESAGLLSLLLFEEDSRPEDALKFASEAILKNPNAIEGLLARTSIHLDAGQYDLAQLDAERAVSSNPLNGRAWSSDAQVKFALFDFVGARDSAKNAINYMSNHIGTWHLLGWAHLMLNELPEALEAFQYSLTLDRTFAETHGGLAAVYAHMHDLKLANHHVTLAEKLDPFGFAAVYAKMVIFNANNQHNKAKSLFNDFTSRTHNKLGKSPQDLIEKRLFELSTQELQGKNIH